MNEFKADLHIHTVLSPCGSLDMSPVKVINYAAAKGMDIIGITDHNTTRHCELIRELGTEKGIYVLTGAEVNTREEIHCLSFFENPDELQEFQKYLDEWLAPLKNDPDKFGDQVQVNRKNEIVYIEEKALFASVNQSIEEVAMKVHELNGIFIPAHIDRPRNSIYSQLGFFPEGLKVDGVEVFRTTDPFAFVARHPELEGLAVIKSSDAHFPEDIARNHSIFTLRNRSFGEIRLALEKTAGREVRTI